MGFLEIAIICILISHQLENKLLFHRFRIECSVILANYKMGGQLFTYHVKINHSFINLEHNGLVN